MANDGNIFGPGNIDEIINNINSVVGNADDVAAIPSDTTSVIAIIKKIYSTVINIASAILTLTETGATLTMDGTEQNVYINNAPAGVFSPRFLKIDFTNQTAAETVVIREYYRIKTGGNFIKVDKATFIGIQDPMLKRIELSDNRYGVKVTMELTAGANKDYDYGVTYAI